MTNLDEGTARDISAAATHMHSSRCFTNFVAMLLSTLTSNTRGENALINRCKTKMDTSRIVGRRIIFIFSLGDEPKKSPSPNYFGEAEMLALHRDTSLKWPSCWREMRFKP